MEFAAGADSIDEFFLCTCLHFWKTLKESHPNSPLSPLQTGHPNSVKDQLFFHALTNYCFCAFPRKITVTADQRLVATSFASSTVPILVTFLSPVSITMIMAGYSASGVLLCLPFNAPLYTVLFLVVLKQGKPNQYPHTYPQAFPYLISSMFSNYRIFSHVLISSHNFA